MIQGSSKNNALKTSHDLMKATDIISGKAKTRVGQDLLKDAVDVFNNPKSIKGLSPRQLDQIKAKILSNPSIFKAWGYYNMARRIADRIKSGADLLSAILEDDADAPIAKGPFRPPQWNGLPTDMSQLVLVKTNIGGYFFDAVIREDHTTSTKITSHPVQTGANITDHSYMEPAVVTIELGMSDAMDSLVPGQFTGKYTKSTSAYQALLDMQTARLPISVLTRVHLYENMLIESITVPDDVKTLYGLRCTVTLREIFLVEVSKTTVSARPVATGSSNRGPQQSVEATGSIASKLDGMIGGGG